MKITLQWYSVRFYSSRRLEFCEDNSGSAQKCAISEKIRGGGGGGGKAV